MEAPSKPKLTWTATPTHYADYDTTATTPRAAVTLNDQQRRSPSRQLVVASRPTMWWSCIATPLWTHTTTAKFEILVQGCRRVNPISGKPKLV